MTPVTGRRVDVGRRIHRLRRNIARPAKKFGARPPTQERLFRCDHAQRRRTDSAKRDAREIDHSDRCPQPSNTATATMAKSPCRRAISVQHQPEPIGGK